MCYFTNCFILLGLPKVILSINVNIKALIDLGPNPAHKYPTRTNQNVPRAVDDEFIADNKRNSQNVPRAVEDEFFQDNKQQLEMVTAYSRDVSNIDENKQDFKSRAVKEDGNATIFALHVFKQSMKLFEELKKNYEPQIADKIDIISRNYEDTFRAFLNETLDRKIKTKLGTQRVIFDILDTSNRLIRRLTNLIVADIKKEDGLRSKVSVADIFQTEINKENDVELKHICSKFQICKSTANFSDFLIKFLTVILSAKNEKIKQAFDAVTEVLLYTDLDVTMHYDTKKNFDKKIKMAEHFDELESKSVFLIFKNLLAMKNKPLNDIENYNNKYINKTIAVLEIIDEIDKILVKDEKNVLAWNKMEISIIEWSDGKREDVLNIWKNVTDHVLSGINKMKPESLDLIRDNMKIIFDGTSTY